MMRVIVLGASGMLGSMVTDVLSRDPDLDVSGTVRSAAMREQLCVWKPDVKWRIFDAMGPEAGLEEIKGQQWVVNCIGITKPLIHDDNAAEVENAIRINSILPCRIAAGAAAEGSRVIQIATDCVYSGARGAYREEDPHDALDVYGKTKSLGEVRSPIVHHLRCSIIGPELKDFKFLLEWFRRQPQRAELKGYANHLWNGVTTLHFAKVCLGIIKYGLNLPSVQHVVPADAVTKDGLLREFVEYFQRGDIEIEAVEAQSVLDRTLHTSRAELNRAIWRAAGYESPPTVSTMVRELSQHDHTVASPARS